MLNVKLLTETAIPPARAHATDGGLDLFADEAVIVRPAQRQLVKCGFAIEIPVGYVGDVRPRSGLAVKEGITVLNSPGTIDPGYRGEVMVLLINHGAYNFEITHGMRIAQLVLVLVGMRDVRVVTELTGSERGADGFGSTGV